MTKVAIVYHSTYGHTKLQAEAVLRGAKSAPDTEAAIYTAEEATAKLDAKKWFTLAWKDKVAGAFTNSSSFSGDKVNTLVGLMINAMQHGMIYVSLGMNPGANQPEAFKTLAGPGPDAHNRVGSFIGPMSASFQVAPGEAPGPGDIQTAEIYGKRVATIAAQFARGRASS